MTLLHCAHARAAAHRTDAHAIIACARCLIVGVLVGAMALAAAAIARAESTSATSSRDARDEATRAIPWRHMTPEARQTAQLVVRDSAIYRRLPTRVIDCDPDVFNFLIQHPEVVTDVWRVMGISQVTLEKLADGAYRGSDGAGTNGLMRILFAHSGPDGRNAAVVFADGSYRGQPFTSELRAQSLLLLRWSAVEETNRRNYVTVRVDSFVRIEQLGIELVAKTVQPWIAKTADRNFIETLTFVSNFSRTAEKNPQGMQRLAGRLQGVDEPTRSALVALCFRTAERYAANDHSRLHQAALLARSADARSHNNQTPGASPRF